MIGKRHNHAVIKSIVTVLALISCLAALVSCGAKQNEKPKDEPLELNCKTQTIQIPENADEVYTSEDALITDYLGSYNGALYFLGESQGASENLDLIATNTLILSAERNAKGGTVGVLADLGPVSYMTAYPMHDGKIILDMNTPGNNTVLPEGGAIISVDTKGNIQVLKEHEYRMPLVSMFGDSILCAELPKPGDTEQIVEAYDFESGKWNSLFSLPLACADVGDELVYTGTMLYRMGGVSNDGFWYAAKDCALAEDGEKTASQIKYYDAKNGRSELVLETDEEVFDITGDSKTGYYAAADRDYIINGSQQIAKTTIMPMRMRLQQAVRSIGAGNWIFDTNGGANSVDVVVFDRANNELTNYHVSNKNEHIHSYFLNDDKLDTMLLLITSLSTDGTQTKDADGRRAVVVSLND